MSLPIRWMFAGHSPREPLGVVRVAGRGDVVRERVEPDVGHVLRVPGDRHAPVERRAADREVLEPSLDEAQHLVAAHVGLDRGRVRRVVLEQAVRVRREPEEVVLLAHLFDGPPVDRAVPLDQVVLGVVGLARDAVQALVRALVDVVAAVVVHGLQDLRDRLVVARLGRADVVVVADVEALPDLAPAGLEGVGPLARRDAVLLGGPRDLEPVLVGAGQVAHVVAAQAPVARDEVARDLGVGVADVGHVVRVVDRRGDEEDVPAHGRVMIRVGVASLGQTSGVGWSGALGGWAATTSSRV